MMTMMGRRVKEAKKVKMEVIAEATVVTADGVAAGKTGRRANHHL
jgi:hypothetical protein